MKICYQLIITQLLLIFLHSSKVNCNNQTAKSGEDKYLNNFNGAIADNTLNSISVGKYGPIILNDFDLLEKLQHINRERIPDRRASANGNGAFGFFICTNPNLSQLSKASIFSQVGKKTSLVARFSVAGSRSNTPETVRTAQNGAFKFYTDEGNWDLTGNNLPVFTMRDSIRFADFQHASGRNPVNNLRDLNRLYDYFANVPETLHRLTWIMSDITIPDGWQHMNQYSINTYKLVNHNGDYTYCRFIVATLQGLKWLEDDQASVLRGNQPDYLSAKLWNAIENGEKIEYMLKAQLMTPQQMATANFNPIDPTKLWDVNVYPPIDLGKIVLNKNPTNWFSQIESLAMNPRNLPPGIEASWDKLLQGRLFAYGDAQMYRLGANGHKLTVNRPKKPVINPHIRDGACPDYQNGGLEESYYPNSFGTVVDGKRKPLMTTKITSEEVKHYNSFNDDNYSQVGETWRSFTPDEQLRLVTRFAKDLIKIHSAIRDRIVDEIVKCDKHYADMLVDAIKYQYQLAASENENETKNNE